MPTLSAFDQQRQKVLGGKFTQTASVSSSTVNNFESNRIAVLNKTNTKKAAPVKTTKPVISKPVIEEKKDIKPIIKKGANVLDMFKDKLQTAVVDTAFSFSPIPVVAPAAKLVLNEERKKKIAKIGVDMGKEMLRSMPRSAMTAVLSVTPGDNKQKSFVPGQGSANKTIGKVEKIVFGPDPIVPVRQYGEKTITDFGGNENISKKYGLPLGMALVGIDLVPGLPKKKIAEKLAKETNEQVIKAILRSEVFKESPPEFLEAFAKRIAPVLDPKQIEADLEFFTNVNRRELSGSALSKPSAEILEQRRNAVINKVTTTRQSKAVQANIVERMDEIRNVSDSPEQFKTNIDNLVSQAINNSGGDKEVLSGLRTALNKELRAVAGTSGNYKADYAMLQTLKEDPEMGMVLKGLEAHIEEIDRLLTSAPRSADSIPFAQGAESIYQTERVATQLGTEPKIGQKLDILEPEAVPVSSEQSVRTSDGIVNGKSVGRQDEDTSINSYFRKPVNDIQAKNQKYIQDNLDKTKQDYYKRVKNELGVEHVISADEAKYILPGFKAELSGDYHSPASSLSKYLYDELLKTRKGSANNTVAFLSGGTGSGKTTAIKNLFDLNDYSIVYDTNLTGTSATSKIKKALDAGYKVEVVYVQRDPITAFRDGVIPRVKSKGRIVSIDEHIERHSEAFAKLEELKKEYGEKLDIAYIDNTRGKDDVREVLFDDLPKFDYNKDELKEILDGKLDEAIKSGKITESEGRAIRGEKISSINGEKPQAKSSEQAILETAKNLNEPPGTVRRVVDSVSEVRTKFVEYVQNEQERIRQIVKTKGANVDDTNDPYLKATLYSGRVHTKIEQVNKEADEIIKETKKIADKFGTDSKTIRREVNDYLRFRHAPERNAALGERAAGISDEEAAQGLEAIGSSPRGNQIVELANKAQKINEKVLDMLKEGGVISDELFDLLRNKYKNHVPLQRIIGGSDDIGSVLSGKGLDVRSTGLKRAKGSELEVEDILGNIINNYQQAVLRSEKNIVDNATLKFFRDNNDLFKDLVSIRSPKGVGKDFNGNMILEQTQDPTILQMFENGKKVWIKFNDESLAIAFRGIGKENIGGIMSGVSKFTRLYSGLATRFNPEFALPNKIRDLQETAVYMASQKGIGFKGSAKMVARDAAQQNTIAIIDFLRGGNSEGARLYKEMKEMGGTTGGFGLSNKETVFKSLDQLESLANSRTKRIAPNIIKYIDGWNTIFEDSTRLSVYRQSLKEGLSKERAAFLAKEASINFNRMGRGGPVINAVWMFSNASIQGSTKMIRSLKNPKVLAATVATVGGSVTIVNQWNDRVDPDWRDKVTKWDRLNGLPIMLPNKDGKGASYVTLPVSWGIRPIKIMSDYVYDTAQGFDFNPKEFTGTLLGSVLEAYNPLGGTDLASGLAPTLLDIPFEIARNQSWSGSKIKPDFDKDAPADIQYFDSLGETKTGQTAISISEILQQKLGVSVSPADMKYAFDGYVGGLGRAVNKSVNTVAGIATGDSPSLDEYPIVSRFYRERTDEELKAYGKTETPIADRMLTEEKREDFKEKEDIKPIYNKVQSLMSEGKDAEAQEIIDGLSDDEWEIYKGIKKTDKTRQSKAEKIKMYPTVIEIQKLKAEGKDAEVQKMVDFMTDDEYDDYIRAKKALGVD